LTRIFTSLSTARFTGTRIFMAFENLVVMAFLAVPGGSRRAQ
jgi:hypothetical protein